MSVIISGGAIGIGRAIALRLAGEGADISFSFFKSKNEAHDLKNQISRLGVKVICYKVDIKDIRSVRRWVKKTNDNFGKIDVAINNSAIIIPRAFALTSNRDLQRVMFTNLFGAFNLAHSVLIDFIRERKGTIINISSVAGIIGNIPPVVYATSKAGLIGFTRSLANEVGRYNIRVNAVAPGFIETKMLKQFELDNKNSASNKIPLGRLGKPEEVANVVRFLASEESRYITGQTIVIDGGFSLVR